uniref:Uncharacterized protein n=1 Tax=Arundo donax TaxID=35708 RepID=A0A0A8YY01_ARUDO
MEDLLGDSFKKDVTQRLRLSPVRKTKTVFSLRES